MKVTAKILNANGWAVGEVHLTERDERSLTRIFELGATPGGANQRVTVELVAVEEQPDPLSHPNRDALEVLYFLFYRVSLDGEEFLPMHWVEEHRPDLFGFLTNLFLRVMSPEETENDNTLSHATYWRAVIERAVEELS